MCSPSSICNAPLPPAAPDSGNVALQNTTSRTITYSYDGLYRLTSAVESGATTNSYSYGYDRAGNRTSQTVNGSTSSFTYNNANQRSGVSYDAAGNLLTDGATTYTYDALGRVVTQGGVGHASNGDGVLVQRGTTRYTQDLAAPLSHILSDGTTTYLYGAERLRAAGGAWYVHDALGSVCATLTDSGTALASMRYDPWGQPQTSAIAPFGFTGAFQDGTNVYLRARWYHAGQGTFLGRDPFAGFPELPYSLHPYQYGYSDPVRFTDPTGKLAIMFGGGWGQPDRAESDIGKLATSLEVNNVLKETAKVIGPDEGDVQFAVREILQHIKNKCNEPIILIGYSRGGNAAQRVAKEVEKLTSLTVIDLLVTIAPVWADSPPGGYMKKGSVLSHVNFVSGQGFAALDVPDRDNMWPQGVPAMEEIYQGADNIRILDTSHFTVMREPMMRFKTVRGGGGLPVRVPNPPMENPSPVWNIIRSSIRFVYNWY